MKKSTRTILSLVITAVIAAAMFYVLVPAINVYNQEMWVLIAILGVVFCVAYFLLGLKSNEPKINSKGKSPISKIKTAAHPIKVAIVFIIVPVVVLLFGNLISSTFFNAQKYANIIEVEEAVFEEDMPETGLVTNIALMDTSSATLIGNKTLGELSDIVSQYQVGENYYQINYNKTPKKVANLEYADFFKWFNNRNSGIPGFVMVDPVDPQNNSAEYISFNKPMKYADSAYFSEDLHRALRFSYPTKIFGSFSFEIDEEGNPYYIVSCMAPKIGLFGGMDVNEVIIFDPCDGSHEIYDLEDVEPWVDNVFTGTLSSQKYDWFGTLKNGFWNSVIGNRDCKVTTDDFGYIVIEDDVWFYTGVTSVVSDESNIGFIISNARTGKYKFYSVVGAEEYSAMQAAEGEVQEKNYTASFPSLINVSGEATYIMVLKDNAGYVKLYALVNVENPTIVATASTQTDAKKEYLKLIGDDAEEESPKETLSLDITVKEIKRTTVSGNEILYFVTEDGTYFKQSVAKDETVMFINVGDKISVSYYKTEIDKINQLVEWKPYIEPETNK